MILGYARGVRWTDELIKEKVLQVKDGLGLDRMPSRRECEDYFGDTSLTNAVSKRKRWYSLAAELDLPIKHSETFVGKTFEKIAVEDLSGRGYETKRMSTEFPYDILVEDSVKVDVKASHLFRGRLGNFYTFNLEKPYATCDVYILYCLDDHDSIIYSLIVPSVAVISNTQISVGEFSSKYHCFKERWDILDKYIEFLKGLVS